MPTESNAAVLKGAVLYGLRPAAVSQRVSRLAYGILTRAPYNPKLHNAKDLEITKESCGKYVRNRFFKFVDVGESVDIDQLKTEHFSYNDEDREDIRTSTSGIDIPLNIYASESKDAELTTQPEVKQIGRLTIRVPAGVSGNKGCDVSFTYGQTEIRVLVKDCESGETAEKSVDFLCG